MDLPALLAILRANGLTLRSAKFGAVTPGWTGSIEFTCDPVGADSVELLPLGPDDDTDPRPDVLQNFLRKKAADGGTD